MAWLATIFFLFYNFFRDLFLFYVLVVNLLRVFGIEPGSSGAASAPKGLLLCFYVAEAGTVLSEDRKKTLYSELSLQLGGRIIPY